MHRADADPEADPLLLLEVADLALGGRRVVVVVAPRHRGDVGLGLGLVLDGLGGCQQADPPQRIASSKTAT